MITILPASSEEKKVYAEKMNVSAEKASDILVMKDRDELFGSVAVSVENSELLMLKMNVEGKNMDALDPMDKFVADSLLRAAASYGANQFAYKIVSYQEEAKNFLQAEGFVEEEKGKWILPTSAIVKFSKES